MNKTQGIADKLSAADQEEYQKCEASPVYFYNKYVRKEGQPELTEKQWDDHVKMVEYQRNNPIKLRNRFKDRPVLTEDCYKQLPDFLK